MGGFSSLPGWAKGTVVVIGAASAVLLGFAVRNIIRKIAEGKTAKGEERDVLQTSKDELHDLNNQGVQPTSPDSVYESSANMIFQSLDGCELTGSEIAVKDEVLRVVKNQADWLKLTNAFGVRKLDNCGYGTGDTEYSLPTLLKEQLDAIDWNLSTVWTNLSAELTKRGIKY
jgi:hypothetical protein